MRSAASGSFTFTIISLCGEDFVGVVDDARAGGDVLVVAQPGADAGAALDQHLVAVMHQLGDRRGHQPDAVFVILDLLWNANAHPGAQSRWPARSALVRR